MSNIIRNAIRTPDGTILESIHRHDYIEHKDKNGVTYMIDGGLDYFRRGGAMDYEDLSVILEDGHEKVREALKWGTYGPEGKGPFKRVTLCDMSTEHIQACLDECVTMYPQYRTAMENELEYRK
jgi:hypothetical protein